MTQVQIRHLEALSGYSTIKKETKELLFSYFINTKKLEEKVALKIYSYLFTPPYNETIERR